MKLGIVGLPNVGKSTLFNAITGTANAQAANYPFCTIEPNTGIVAVPDERLDKLIEMNPAITGKVDVSNLTQRDPDEQILVIAGGNCTSSFDDDHDYTSEDI